MSDNPTKRADFYRWKADASGMEFKCNSCGHWLNMDCASGLIATDGSPSCKQCIDLLLSSFGKVNS